MPVCTSRCAVDRRNLFAINKIRLLRGSLGEDLVAHRAYRDTVVHMSTTITIRTGDPLRKRLEERAAATGTTLSALVREILENAVAERSLGRRAGYLKGRLKLPSDGPSDWADSIRNRNWRA